MGKTSGEEISSEHQKDVKPETVPDKSVAEKEVEELGKQEPATISEKVTELKEEKTEAAPQKSGDDSKELNASKDEMGIKQDTAQAKSAESQRDESKKDTQEDKQEPAAKIEKVSVEKDLKIDAATKKSGDDKTQKEKLSDPEKDVIQDIAPEKSVESQKDGSKPITEKDKPAQPAAVLEKAAEKKDFKTDVATKTSDEDINKEKSSETEKDVKPETVPDQSVSKKEAEEPETSEAKKDVKPDTAPAKSGESQNDKSGEDTEKDKQGPAAVQDKVVENKDEKTETPPKKSGDDCQKKSHQNLRRMTNKNLHSKNQSLKWK